MRNHWVRKIERQFSFYLHSSWSGSYTYRLPWIMQVLTSWLLLASFYWGGCWCLIICTQKDNWERSRSLCFKSTLSKKRWQLSVLRKWPAQSFASALPRGETLDELLVEAYALVREADKRVLGLFLMMCRSWSHCATKEMWRWIRVKARPWLQPCPLTSRL